MNNKKEFSTVILGVVALLVLGGLGAFWPKWVNANISATVAAPDTVVADAITHQGYLTDDKGKPLNGDFIMRFQLYNASAGGTLLWDSANKNVAVVDGLFSVRLGIAEDIFNGEELWLAQTVEGELLTPRQEILPTPLAHSLRPGAIVKGTASAVTNNYTLEVVLNNDTFAFNRGAIKAETTTGNAIYAVAKNGRAVYGQTENGYGVYGFDGGSTPNQGYGGYFYSTNGIGVYGYSGADRSHPNIYAPGVYGQSNQGVGVYGRGDTSGSSAFYNEGGRFEGGKGIYARGTGSASDSSYGASIYSDNYRGMYVQSLANYYDAYFGGSFGISTFGITDRSARSQSLVINMGDTTINPGDLVAMAGVAPSPENGEPMLAVAKVDSSNQNAVIGVALEMVRMQMVTQEDGAESVDFSPAGGVIKPNSYLVIITDGLAPAVNIDSISRSVEWTIGDKIALSPTGAITRSSDTIGDVDKVVIGKVAGPINTQNGTVPLFVDID
ncbi:MAG: hypothetical protein ACI85U_002549 [Candidatus Promineifilaceae bacterium]|jgi:hypothetical protein